ncbi:MAG: hypothetical protein HY047_09455 [Acidobacteria bacterium]|nr:hypothetical protein [Acidobacteriota bacterium]
MLAFTSATAALTGILFSVVPAWRVTRHDPASALQQNARTIAGTGRTGKVLIVAQVGLSVVLLRTLGCWSARSNSSAASPTASSAKASSSPDCTRGQRATRTSIRIDTSRSWPLASPCCQASAPSP